MTDAERAWLEARAAEVWDGVRRAPPAWSAWAEAELSAGPIGASLRGATGGLATGEWDRVRGRALRASLGQVFTPTGLAREVARTVIRPEEPDGLVLDPACGAGSLLLAVCDGLREAGVTTAAALAAVEGWDRDPVAAWLCRANLVRWALDQPVGPTPGPLAVVTTDALGDGRPREIRGVRRIVGNPPYLEAKRMGRAEPGLRERLVERFPQLHGAFDLYLAFVWLCLELVEPDGEVALILPNKVCQGRYAAGLRRALLGPDGPTLLAVTDLSRVAPRPFPGTGVYPAILHLGRRPATAPVRVRRATTLGSLAREPWFDVPLDTLRSVGGEWPIFVPFAETWPHLEPLFAGPRFRDVAEAVSTCSFHARGLRERHVFADPGGDRLPYLGLHSRARRTEVAPFRVRWDGGWIDYDQAELAARGNPLPPLDRVFRRPKVIWCQHALRMRAVADADGRWVTKDTYPVGWPHTGSVFRLAAVLNSTVFTALYNTIYQGVVVGGETYHYLPAFLAHVPVPRWDHPELDRAESIAASLHGDGDVDGLAWEALDRSVAAAYGVPEEGRRVMVEVHLRRVGAEVPG